MPSTYKYPQKVFWSAEPWLSFFFRSTWRPLAFQEGRQVDLEES